MSLSKGSTGEFKTGSAPPPALELAREIEWACVTERVLQALRRTGYSALQEIVVSVREDVVILQGRVANYHLKQIAQETARQALGNAPLRNVLEVA